jgi:hypothetical protein
LDGIGFKDGALKWLKDYMKDRTNTVKCSDSTSSEVSLDVGVPQGSVLGPLLFTIYLKEVGSVILQHNVRYIAYADDIQLFVHVHPSQIEVATSQLQDCIADLQSWLRSRQLKMNPRKTEFIVLGRRVMISKVYAQPPKLLINNHEIVAKSSVRDLGLIIDSCLTMEPQANNACRIAFLYLRNISRHRIYLDKHATKMLVNAFVLGRIFYCSSLLFCITKKVEKKFQRVIHYAVRLVGLLKRRDNVSSIMNKEHWLSIREQINKRIASLVFDIFVLFSHSRTPRMYQSISQSPLDV